MWRKTAICPRDELQESEDHCLTHGTAAGKYAGRLLKASCAAQPKGCSACFVPQTHYEMQINRDFTLSQDSRCRDNIRALQIKQKKRPRKSEVFFVVEIDGVEPTTLCLQSRCSSQLSYIPVCACKCRYFFLNCKEFR